MAKVIYLGLLFVSIVLYMDKAYCQTSQAETDEIQDNSVKATFYSLSTSEWADKVSTFTTILLQRVNKRCEKQPMDCGLEDWHSSYNFSSTSYNEFSPDTSEKNYLSITFYLSLSSVIPREVRNITQYVLTKNALEGALQDVREAINDDLGTAIVSINDKPYPAPYQGELDAIMIPVSFALVIVIIIAALACYFYRRQRDRSDRKKKYGKPKKADRRVDGEATSQNSPHRARVAPAPGTKQDVEKGASRDRRCDYLPSVNALSVKESYPKNPYGDKHYTSPQETRHMRSTQNDSPNRPQTVVTMNMTNPNGWNSESQSAEYNNSALPPMTNSEDSGKKHKKKKSKKSKHHYHVNADNTYEQIMNIPPTGTYGPKLDSESDNSEFGRKVKKDITEL